MKDTKVRIERSKFDVDCELNYAEISGGGGGSFTATLSLPTGLKPSDFVGKILHFSATESSSITLTFESTAIVTRVSTIRMTVANALQVNTYGGFDMDFMGEPMTGALVYNATTGQAAITLVSAYSGGGGE